MRIIHGIFWLAVALFGRLAPADPISVHIAIIDGVVTTSVKADQVEQDLRVFSVIQDPRVLRLHVGPRTPGIEAAAKFQEQLKALLHDQPRIDTLVIQGDVTIDHAGRMSLHPFGQFKFGWRAGAERFWTPLRGLLTEDASVVVLDGHALAGRGGALRVRAAAQFFGAPRATFFGLTGEPDASGRRVKVGQSIAAGELLYPGLDAWKVYGCDRKLGKLLPAVTAPPAEQTIHIYDNQGS